MKLNAKKELNKGNWTKNNNPNLRSKIVDKALNILEMRDTLNQEIYPNIEHAIMT